MDADSIGCSENTPMPSPHFAVVLAYQDLPTGMHARQFLNHVLDHCQLGAEFSLTLWKLDLFHAPEISQQAVQSACDAALVLLALRGDLGLEATTEKWLTEWIAQRHGDECALAVLIDCDLQRLDSIGQTLFQLQDITRLSRVRLFVGFMPSVATQTQSTARPESENTETMLAVHDNHWHPVNVVHEGGINE